MDGNYDTFKRVLISLIVKEQEKITIDDFRYKLTTSTIASLVS